jgi:hydrogenase accessory protein HypB
MCTICGCGSAIPHAHDFEHHRHDDHRHDHHRHDEPRQDGHAHHGHGQTVDHAHADLPQTRRVAPETATRIRIERDLLAENDRHATANRAFLTRRGAVALNLLSSPGSGKTTLLERTVADLRQRLPIAVIEGDQETSFDADRVRAAGVRAVQINTGKVCHLDAHMVGHALSDLDPPPGSAVFIENVGNLVCPSAFDLGEAKKVVFLSVTEGDDKPRKYKDMFAVADLVLITKIDLLPYVRFDLARCLSFAEAVNPGVPSMAVSAFDGSGLEAWYAWIAACVPATPAQPAQPTTTTAGV